MHQINKTRTTARGYTVRHSSRRLPDILSGRTSRVSQQPLARGSRRSKATPGGFRAFACRGACRPARSHGVPRVAAAEEDDLSRNAVRANLVVVVEPFVHRADAFSTERFGIPPRFPLGSAHRGPHRAQSPVHSGVSSCGLVLAPEKERARQDAEPDRER